MARRKVGRAPRVIASTTTNEPPVFAPAVRDDLPPMPPTPPVDAARERSHGADADGARGGTGARATVPSPSTNEGERRKPFTIMGVRPSRIAAIGIAAITTSIVSTKLMSTLNSFIALALVSMISTLSIEIYSKLIKGTRKTAAKVAYHLPYEKVLSDAAAQELDEKLLEAMQDTITSGMAPVATPHLKGTGEGPGDEAAEDNDAGTGDGMPGSTGRPGRYAAEQTAPGHDEQTDEENNQRHAGRLMQGLLLFIIVSSVTLGGMYVIERYVAKPETNVYPQTSLSQSDEQKIIDAAVAAAKEQAGTTTNGGADRQQLGKLQQSIDSLKTQQDELGKQVDALQRNQKGSGGNDDRKTTDDAADIAELKQTIAQIQDQLNTLQTQVSGLSNNQQSGGQTGSTGTGAAE